MPDWRIAKPLRRVGVVGTDIWNADFDLFTITGGCVRVMSLYGHVTAAATGAAARPRLRFTEVLGPTASFMSVAAAAGAWPINTMITWDGLLAGLLVVGALIGHVVLGGAESFGGSGLTFAPGTIDLDNVTLGAVDATLAIDWYLEYVPLTQGAVVTVA